MVYEAQFRQAGGRVHKPGESLKDTYSVLGTAGGFWPSLVPRKLASGQHRSSSSRGSGIISSSLSWGKTGDPGGWKEISFPRIGILLTRLWRLSNHHRHKVTVGLDNAGRTTILCQFSMDEVVHTSSTIGSNVEGTMIIILINIS